MIIIIIITTTTIIIIIIVKIKIKSPDRFKHRTFKFDEEKADANAKRRVSYGKDGHEEKLKKTLARATEQTKRRAKTSD